MQLVEGFTPEPHDVPVDIIVTEKEVIRCRLR
jgi:5-formyltetrahydrofolate cyclo-ligase